MRKLPITLMHVIVPETVGWPVPGLQSGFAESQEQNARDILERAHKTVQSYASDVAVRTEIRRDGVGKALVDASRDAYLTVVGTRGMGALGRTILGSVGSVLVHYGYGPIAIVPADDIEAPDTAPVLLGIDGSPASEEATALAFDEASRRGVELVALHAWSDIGAYFTLGMDWRKFEDEGREVLGERLAGWQERYPDVKVRRRIVCNQPAHKLIEESRQTQLLIVGTHGRSGVAGRLGSVSTAVTRQPRVPTIVVRPRQDQK